MTLASQKLTALDLGVDWRNSFAQLGPRFYTPLAPWPLPTPYWVGRSSSVARELGLNAAWLNSPELLEVLAGNQPLVGTQPLASVYSGHQFGQWAGQLGDGRAILLGETAGLEVQLKGSGLTPYSRMGDGRAVLRSSIREFLCSEAMHGLGIATSRALCVIGSDAPIRRETMETAAVVTRVAPSFIRFGHFEHFSHHDQPEQLKILADHVIDRFYPACRNSENFAGNPYAALLEAVSERTADMVAQWQAVGFCHGVMNTDNMSILGLTIDYGPFQFLDGFDPSHICNHSDTQGRYAFNQQPNIAYWNLFCLGQALLPLIGEQELALAALESYKTVFPAAFERRMFDKLGLADASASTASLDRALLQDLLQLLAKEKVDYTIFWRRLSHASAGTDASSVRDLFVDRTAAEAWLLRYSERMAIIPPGLATDLMLKNNPKFVLRNHLGEQAIQSAKEKDFSQVDTLLMLLESPYEEHPGFDDFAGFAPDWASSIEISCSS
ncbi:MAG: YdiU family protein [Gammaproteobacteria bacterium]|uniref:protein adenylyltransferase SelO n=1 Tax=Rhodoferax sp. TaxID=50421 RepID=UPI00179A4229|nr:YdiU family protein [Rhodoferax sp.]MBU3900912.1 YdiU family protein [Gammaproteobacteria bacterium]MBA3056422.1 YdiU family protein [Rhodoferax sp.]MBU3998056.1 YdiU family protein [Gammaproteobacteria bacterium]MBU4017539.1 YdiU family protein [Gammaproteobacteria bacterium]MBU4078741.1 YdiU family protein [Gammaproteobacteria bacterium]